MLKERFDFLTKIPFFSKIVISALIYLGLSIGYSNLTWGDLRAKVPFFNRMFYSPKLSLVSYYEKFKKEEKKDSEEGLSEEGSLAVELLNIKEESNTPVLSYSALLEPIEKVEIYSKVSGRLEKTFVNEGDSVSQGQKLAKLDSLTFELDLAKQKAALESSQALYRLSGDKLAIAKRNLEIKLGEADKRINLYNKAIAELERFQEVIKKKEILLENKVITEEEMANLRLELNTREINVSNAKRDLDMVLVGIRDEDIQAEGLAVPADRKEKNEVLKKINTKIEASEQEVAFRNLKAAEVNLQTTEMLIKESILYSPLNGVVAKINRTAGELVNAGSGGSLPILTVISVKSVYVAFSVNEGDLFKLKVGLKADIKADVSPDKTYRGTVKRISPFVDSKTHTAEVKIQLDNQHSLLKPGMFVRCEVITGKEEKSIFVPLTSLIALNETDAFIFVVRNKRAYKKQVKLGAKKEDKVEILDGLEEGDSIALSSISRLFDGILITPKLQ